MTSLALPDASADAGQLRRFLAGLPAVDAEAVEARASALAGQAPDVDVDALWDPRRAAETAIGLTDLTTLEGTDTPDRVRALGGAAVHPDPQDPSCPPVAALCVYSDLVPAAVEAVAGSGVRVAAVAGAFPSGRAPLAVRAADVEAAVAAGADEVDLVMDRGAFLDGRYADVVGQLRTLRRAAEGAHLKVILETAELGGLPAVRDAAWLALLAGADVVKTSTGKLPAGATLPDVLVLLEAVTAFEAAAGRPAGVKASGGVRTAAVAGRYLALVARAAGEDWLSPDRFRFGASSLLADLVRARRA